MARILLIVFIVFLIYLLFRGLSRARLGKAPPPAAPTTVGEDMVTCARCGVNVPRSEAKEVDGRLICDGNPNCR